MTDIQSATAEIRREKKEERKKKERKKKETTGRKHNGLPYSIGRSCSWPPSWRKWIQKHTGVDHPRTVFGDHLFIKFRGDPSCHFAVMAVLDIRRFGLKNMHARIKKKVQRL